MNRALARSATLDAAVGGIGRIENVQLGKPVLPAGGDRGHRLERPGPVSDLNPVTAEKDAHVCAWACLAENVMRGVLRRAMAIRHELPAPGRPVHGAPGPAVTEVFASRQRNRRGRRPCAAPGLPRKSRACGAGSLVA